MLYYDIINYNILNYAIINYTWMYYTMIYRFYYYLEYHHINVPSNNTYGQSFVCDNLMWTFWRPLEMTSTVCLLYAILLTLNLARIMLALWLIGWVKGFSELSRLVKVTNMVSPIRGMLYFDRRTHKMNMFFFFVNLPWYKQDNTLLCHVILRCSTVY